MYVHRDEEKIHFTFVTLYYVLLRRKGCLPKVNSVGGMYGTDVLKIKIKN